MRLRTLPLLVRSLAVFSSLALVGEPSLPRLARAGDFSSWRPYHNPNRLVSLGMNKGEVLALAGKPEREESYYQGSAGRLTRVSDWYYFRGGLDPETTILKFVEDRLVSIDSTPVR